jgi:hypothetical protein
VYGAGVSWLNGGAGGEPRRCLLRRYETAGGANGEGARAINVRKGEERIPRARWEYTRLILCKILIYANVRLRTASFGMRPCAGPGLLAPTLSAGRDRYAVALSRSPSGRRSGPRRIYEQTFMPSDSSRVLVFVARAVALHASCSRPGAGPGSRSPHPKHKPAGSGPSAAGLSASRGLRPRAGPRKCGPSARRIEHAHAAHHPASRHD